MKKTIIALAAVLSMLAVAATAQSKPAEHSKSGAGAVEAQVGKLWEAFKNGDKATLSNLLDDGFQMFEEGLTAIADKKAEVNSVDDYQLLNYTLTDFTVKSLGPDSALVTYTAQYEGKSGGEVLKAKSVFAEVWVRSGGAWKDLYLQETYVK